MIRLFSVSLVIFAASWNATAQIIHDVTVSPLDLSESVPVEAWPSSVNQLEVVDKGYILRSGKAPMIWYLDRQGQMLKTIGGRGEGPGMLGDYGPRAFAQSADVLLVFSPQWNRFTLYASGEYITSFKLNRPSFRKHPLIAKGSALDGQRIVMPSYDKQGQFTASVYNLEGHFQRDVGTPLPTLDNALDGFLFRNQTMWLRIPNGWCSVHVFAPQVTLYDLNFRETVRWWLQGPDLNAQFDNNLALAVQDPNRLVPLMNDVQVIGNALFFTANGKLHRFSFHKEQVTDVIRFRGSGPAFQQLPSPYVAFNSFAMDPSGHIILGHPAMMWGHDLWTAQLPKALTLGGSAKTARGE